MRATQFERWRRRHRDIQANASAGATGVDAPVAEGRAVPALAGNAGAELKGLITSQLGVSIWVRLNQDQLAILGQNEKIGVHQDEAAHAEVVSRPFQVAGAQLDAVEWSR